MNAAFVLLLFTPYEGHTLLGVYSTRKLAEDAGERFKRAAPPWAYSSSGDWEKLEIVEVEVDGAPLGPSDDVAEDWKPLSDN